LFCTAIVCAFRPAFCREADLRGAVINQLLSSNDNFTIDDDELTVQNNLVQTSYVNVELVENSLGNTFENAVISAFESSATLWSSVITTRLNPVQIPGGAATIQSRCGVPTPQEFSGEVDNLLIIARIRNIDGAGGTLGQARICMIMGGFPRVGVMDFDSADVNNLINRGTFDNTVQHEMGHVLGLGTRWQTLLTPGLADPQYLGTGGIAGYQSLGGQGDSVPVENQGGPGTARGHWRQETFGDEIMTGFLTGNNQPLSIMTVRALEDLGYATDRSQAQPYQISNPGQNSPNRIPMNDMPDDDNPWFVDFDNDGRWRWFRPNSAGSITSFQNSALAVFNVFLVYNTVC